MSNPNKLQVPPQVQLGLHLAVELHQQMHQLEKVLSRGRQTESERRRLPHPLCHSRCAFVGAFARLLPPSPSLSSRRSSCSFSSPAYRTSWIVGSSRPIGPPAHPTSLLAPTRCRSFGAVVAFARNRNMTQTSSVTSALLVSVCATSTENVMPQGQQP